MEQELQRVFVRAVDASAWESAKVVLTLMSERDNVLDLTLLRSSKFYLIAFSKMFDFLADRPSRSNKGLMVYIYSRFLLTLDLRERPVFMHGHSPQGHQQLEDVARLMQRLGDVGAVSTKTLASRASSGSHWFGHADDLRAWRHRYDTEMWRSLDDPNGTTKIREHPEETLHYQDVIELLDFLLAGIERKEAKKQRQRLACVFQNADQSRRGNAAVIF